MEIEWAVALVDWLCPLPWLSYYAAWGWWWVQRWLTNIYYGNAMFGGRPIIYYWHDLLLWWRDYIVPYWWVLGLLGCWCCAFLIIRPSVFYHENRRRWDLEDAKSLGALGLGLGLFIGLFAATYWYDPLETSAFVFLVGAVPLWMFGHRDKRRRKKARALQAERDRFAVLEAQLTEDYKPFAMWYEQIRSKYFSSGVPALAPILALPSLPPYYEKNFVEAAMEVDDAVRNIVGTAKEVTIAGAISNMFWWAEDRYKEYHQAQGSIIIGRPENIPGVYDANNKPVVTITPRELAMGVYVRGMPGAGKSMTMRNILVQHAADPGWGEIVVSPETDLLCDRIMPYIPSDRFNDVIYINPKDASEPRIGWNPLHVDPGVEWKDAHTELSTILKRVLSLRDKMAELLEMSLAALMQRKGSTFKDFTRLLSFTDDSLRRSIARDDSTDDHTQAFWEEEVDLDNKSYYRGSYKPLLNQLGPLLRPPLVDFFSVQSLNWHKEINLNSRIILIYVGGLGQGTEMQLFGQLVIGTIQQTLMRRETAGIPKDQYRKYCLSLDEFWMFADASKESFMPMFPHLRKYAMYIMPAHQTNHGIDRDVLGMMRDTLGTMICMKLSSEDAANFAKKQRMRDFEGRLHLDVYQDLQPGHGVVTTPNPMWSRATPIAIPEEPPIPRNPDADPQTIIELSKKNFGKKGEPIGKAGEDAPPPGKPGNPWTEPKVDPPKGKRGRRSKTLFDTMGDKEGTFAG